MLAVVPVKVSNFGGVWFCVVCAKTPADMITTAADNTAITLVVWILIVPSSLTMYLRRQTIVQMMRGVKGGSGGGRFEAEKIEFSGGYVLTSSVHLGAVLCSGGAADGSQGGSL